MWVKYLNLGKNSGIIKYQINFESIDIMFKNGDIHTYPEYKIGRNHLETMFALAKQGRGLHAYIMRNPDVKTGFVR